MWISFLPKDMPYLRAHYLHLYCGGVEHILLSENKLKWKHNVALTFLSGFWISGKTAQNGLITSKNLTVEEKNEQKKSKRKIL